jgi:hypothetical protein
MLFLSWLTAFRARPTWFRKRQSSRRTKRRPLRRSVLRFHWFGRNPRKRYRLQGPKPRPMQSIEACEPRLMPGTLLGSAIDPLAGALSRLWPSDEAGPVSKNATANSTGNTGPSLSESPAPPATAVEPKGAATVPPDAGVTPQTSPVPQSSSLPALDDSLPPQSVPTTIATQNNQGKQHEAAPEIGALNSDNAPRTDNQGGGGSNGAGWEPSGGGDGSAEALPPNSGPSASAPGGGGSHISVAPAKGAKGGSGTSATPATTTNISDTLSPKGPTPIGPLPTTTPSAPTTTNAASSSPSSPGTMHDFSQPQSPTTISIPTDTLDGWSVTQNGGSPTGKGMVFLDSNTLLMHEGDSFDVIASYNVVIPQNPGTLTFRYQNLDFDPTGSSHEINDALEASLVDSNGNSLVPTYASGRDAFFNVTKGQSPALGSSTTFDPSSDRISVDISSLAPGTVATLNLRLVNNDNTTNTTVQIVGDTVAPGVTAQLLDDTAPSGSTNDPTTRAVANRGCSRHGSVRP